MVKEKKPKGPPKKRGRKPKGGKIVNNIIKTVDNESDAKSNIILHLRHLSDFNNIKNNDPEYLNLNNIQNNTIINDEEIPNTNYESKYNKMVVNEDNTQKTIWNKIKKLKYLFHHNEMLDKRSACFWCTCGFDNPAIYIPKAQKNKQIEVYGCFCSPECAVAYLKNEPLDNSVLWERYAMLNNIYAKIYNYTNNIKPAPSPLYTLDKFYGNMSIEEYRQVLNKQYLLIVVDKPLTKVMPELYEDNNDTPNIYNNLLNNSTNVNQVRLERKNSILKKPLF